MAGHPLIQAASRSILPGRLNKVQTPAHANNPACAKLIPYRRPGDRGADTGICTAKLWSSRLSGLTGSRLEVDPRVRKEVARRRVTCSLASEDVDVVEDDFQTRTANLVQWYPGHIAKAEAMLRTQLQSIDILIEVRDARIPMATSHPMLQTWARNKPCVLILNREDMVAERDKARWASYFAAEGQTMFFTDGRTGKGTRKVLKEVLTLCGDVNKKRRARGLKPRAIRAAVAGFPNVGKSALINRLLGRKLCNSAPKPGVTRQLRWLRVGGVLDLLDSPGVLPMRLADQEAATLLAICNDIGEAAYTPSAVGAILVERIKRMFDREPAESDEGEAAVARAGDRMLEERYGVLSVGKTGEQYVAELAQARFNGDEEAAGTRLLNDYRKLAFGQCALESPPRR
eukprot:jgi/Mesvir1/27043/Mv20740-RA.1